jgi:hypothetical protein
MPVQRICTECGLSYSRTPKKAGPFCSRACSAASRKGILRESLTSRITRQSAPGPGGCLLWTGHRHPFGYGLINIGQRQHGVHRVVWELANGPIPKGLQVQHWCNVPACINLEHLSVGTPKQNSQWMVTSGRTGRIPSETLLRGDRHPARIRPGYLPRGERHGMSKLTAEDVLAIRARNQAGEPRASIAASFGIAKATIWWIVTRRTWKHVV